MNPVIFTTRPALSTISIAADLQENSHTLDELLVIGKAMYLNRTSPPKRLSASWFSQGDYLGFDDDNHLMYGLTRSESWLFSVGTITGLAVLVSLVNWLCL